MIAMRYLSTTRFGPYDAIFDTLAPKIEKQS